jgi:anti-sigma regulatory factor (Ser/Thr protein kinase)
MSPANGEQPTGTTVTGTSRRVVPRRRRPLRRGRLKGDGLAIVLPGGPHAPAEARSAVGVMGRDLGRELLDSLRLLVTELVTNSVLHGGAGDDDPLRLEVTLSPRAVRVEVSDLGPGFEPQARVQGIPGDGGWGLLIVDRLADRWGVRQRGRCVWFELDRT